MKEALLSIIPIGLYYIWYCIWEIGLIKKWSSFHYKLTLVYKLIIYIAVLLWILTTLFLLLSTFWLHWLIEIFSSNIGTITPFIIFLWQLLLLFNYWEEFINQISKRTFMWVWWGIILYSIMIEQWVLLTYSREASIFCLIVTVIWMLIVWIKKKLWRISKEIILYVLPVLSVILTWYISWSLLSFYFWFDALSLNFSSIFLLMISWIVTAQFFIAFGFIVTQGLRFHSLEETNKYRFREEKKLTSPFMDKMIKEYFIDEDRSRKDTVLLIFIITSLLLLSYYSEIDWIKILILYFFILQVIDYIYPYFKK